MKGHARNIMTHHATVVTDDTSLGAIASILVHARIGGVPVVDEVFGIETVDHGVRWVMVRAAPVPLDATPCRAS